MTNEQEAKMEAIQYRYSVKIEQTALGARISTHAYGDNQDNTVEDAINLYIGARRELMQMGYPIAPEEPKPKKVTGKEE